MNTVEMNAADALLDRRLKITLPAPWLLRVFGKKTIPVWIKLPAYQTLLRMARLTAKMDIDLGKLQTESAPMLFATIAEHGVTASRIIALGMLRGALSSWLLNHPVAWYLRWNMDARTMAELTKILVVTSGAEAFVSIITSEITMKVTIPTVSQPTTTGS